MRMIFYYSLAWIPMVFIAIVNGGLRDAVYKPYVGELAAHQISSVTGVALFFVYTWAISRRWKLESGRQALAAGLLWLGLTVAFEFLFGHFVMHHPWEKLFADYNLLAGRVWALVLVCVALLPYAVYRIRK